MPEVTTTSPGLTSAVPGTYSSDNVSVCWPNTTPCARVRSINAATAALRSTRSGTFVARQGAHVVRRARADDLGRDRLDACALPEVEQLSKALGTLCKRAFLLEPDVCGLQFALQRFVFLLH